MRGEDFQRAEAGLEQSAPRVSLPTTRVTLEDITTGTVTLSADVDAVRFMVYGRDALEKFTRPAKIRKELYSGGQRVRGKQSTSGWIYSNRSTGFEELRWERVPHIGLGVIEQSGIGVLDIELYFPRLRSEARRHTALSDSEKSVLHEALLLSVRHMAGTRARDGILTALSHGREQSHTPCSAATLAALHAGVFDRCKDSKLGAPVVYVQSVGQKKVTSSLCQLQHCLQDIRQVTADEVLSKVRVYD